MMGEPVSLLLREFLTWVSSRRRTYAEAMDAWRTSCPRLTVWEDALLGGLIQIESGGPFPQSEVTLTPRGRSILDGNHTQELASTDPAAAAEPGVDATQGR
jgi:hypothetical protein